MANRVDILQERARAQFGRQVAAGVPLSELDQGDWEALGGVHNKVLRFPERMGYEEQKATLLFRAYEPKAVDLVGLGRSFINFLDQAKTFTGTLLDQSFLAQLRANDWDWAKTFENVVGVAQESFAGTDIRATTSSPREETGAMIALYLPPNITIPDTIDYGNVNLGAIGAGAQQAISAGGGNVVGATGTGLRTLIDAVVGNASNTGNAGQLGAVGAAMLTNMLGQEAIGGAIKGATRVTVNPNTRTIFNNVNVREFSFDFVLVPTSRKEATQLELIIQEFRKQIYPDVIFDPEGKIPLGFKFPNVFEITAMYKGGVLPQLDFRTCYLRNISTSYNPSQMGMFRDGKFNEVRMTLTFVEAKPLSRKDIEKWYDKQKFWAITRSEGMTAQDQMDAERREQVEI